ncbi:hypothetical protein [Carboxylicivirga caseinilyticus]|uniref:hypothetical protein n=1 Tax=Carboxylicivirga caseinilyticus TaxID=3417572 RepID=UPI003D34AA3F|nr:hypothetical protein [Marinilabiliaceae bacterium A049]
MELTRKDIQVFYGCSYVTAGCRINEIKRGLNLHSKGRVLLAHLAKYEGLTLDECKQAINLMRMNNTG